MNGQVKISFKHFPGQNQPARYKDLMVPHSLFQSIQKNGIELSSEFMRRSNETVYYAGQPSNADEDFGEDMVITTSLTPLEAFTEAVQLLKQRLGADWKV